MRLRWKLAIGAAGGLVVAAGLVAITASAVGLSRTATLQSAATSSPTASPAPSATPRAGNPAGRAVNMAVLAAEAQVLGLTTRQLTLDMRQGLTVHQLADRQGISQADFQARFQTDLKAIMDQSVQQGQLTAQQEQQALTRLSRGVPNWDQPPARPGAQASPSPSPS